MHKTANNVRAGQSAITQTSRVGEGQHVFEHLILQFAVFSSHEEIKICRGYKNFDLKQLVMMRAGFVFISTLNAIL